MGLDFGGASELQYPGLDPVEEDLSGDEESDDDDSRIRVWTHRDREDLKKLESLLKFLGVPGFGGSSSHFRTRVIRRLRNSTGPLPGAIQVLTRIMESVMIRHR